MEKPDFDKGKVSKSLKGHEIPGTNLNTPGIKIICLVMMKPLLSNQVND